MTPTLTKSNKAKNHVLENLSALAESAQDTEKAAKQIAATGRRKGAALKLTAAAKAKSADRAVRNNPYRTAGIAFAIGIVLAAFMRRSSSR